MIEVLCHARQRSSTTQDLAESACGGHARVTRMRALQGWHGRAWACGDNALGAHTTRLGGHTMRKGARQRNSIMTENYLSRQACSLAKKKKKK